MSGRLNWLIVHFLLSVILISGLVRAESPTHPPVPFPGPTNSTKNYTVNCSELLSCDLCSSHIELGCGWCSVDAQCYNGSSSGSFFGNCTDGCWSFGGPEACTGSCSDASTCSDCLTQTKCFWCATEQSCKPATLDGSYACGGCASINVSNPYPLSVTAITGDQQSFFAIGDDSANVCWKTVVDQCPASGICNSKQTCSDCTADAGCSWCGSIAQCVEVARNDTTVGCGACGTYGVEDCWKPDSTLCPTLPINTSKCEDLTSCASCTSANCYWCGTSSQCMEASASASPESCGFRGEGCGNYTAGSCWKGPNTTTPATCPSVSSCSVAETCAECVSFGCFWCGASQQCLESSSDGQSVCASGSSCVSCWKGGASEALCPAVPRCAVFTNSCALCLENGCGFCKNSGECAEVGSDGQRCEAGGNACEQWVTDSCEGICESYADDCESCLASPAHCGLCSGFSNGSMLISQCVSSLENGSAPANGTLQCAIWHNQTATCPSCQEYSSNCFECAARSNCGWCQLPTQGSLCLEGSARYSFDQSQCEYAGGVYNGTTCNPLLCPSTSAGQCNGTGVCNSTVGLCKCTRGWEGPACTCQLSVCNGGGGGHCENGTCLCSPNYSGPNCEYYCDPLVSCSGNGVCLPLGGGCNCTAPYYGQTCNSFCENSVNCSGNGHCCAFSSDCGVNSSQVCKCDLGWHGEQCAVLDCRDDSILSCASCNDVVNANGSSVCGWCEDLNTCNSLSDGNSTCDAPLLSDCSSSCSALSQSSCLDGRHCDCVWCVSLEQCFAYNASQSTAPNAPSCYWKYSCTSNPIGVSIPVLLAVCITGGVIMLIVLIWGAYFIFRAPNLYMQLPSDVPE